MSNVTARISVYRINHLWKLIHMSPSRIIRYGGLIRRVSGQLPLVDTSASAVKSPLAVMPETASSPVDSVSVSAVAFLTIPTAAFQVQRHKIGRREERSYRVQPRQTLMPDHSPASWKQLRHAITAIVSLTFMPTEALVSLIHSGALMQPDRLVGNSPSTQGENNNGQEDR